jgi:hypothetical protein
MLSKITFSTALLGNQTAGSELLWQTVITGLFVGAAQFLLMTGLAIYWTFLLCAAIIKTALVHPLFGWLGILPAIGVMAGVFEETGFRAAGVVNAISYILWSVWLIAFGAALLLR